jgi:bifunctional UDP-N-acetylglucosamine pyrophosphorylase/glucosamine-1-phosphate N-acetyltransferase
MSFGDLENRRHVGRTCLAIVLAAGNGTRMGSARPKVLHKLAGRSMLGHALAAVTAAEADRSVIVVGPDHAELVAEAKSVSPSVETVVQAERRGTAHAVLAAREAILEGYDDILIAFADTPLVRPETFTKLRATLAAGNDTVVVSGFETKAPAGYGRFIIEDGALIAIREEADASEAEQRITLCSAGLMVLDGRRALPLLDAIGNKNAKNEFYLTDIVAVARARGNTASFVLIPEDEVLGVNDRVQLAAAEAALQARLRAKAMQEGASLIDPSSVTFSFDTKLGRDVIVEPYVVFGPGVTVGDGALIRSFCHLESATIGPNASVGPFARLRPGAELAEDVHIGNFVELKAAKIGAGAKINHLSYIGNAHVGGKTNIGAGTITCNYDGFGKYTTEIGENVFVGSHSALVAPVRIGAGAYVGAGSVITADVSPGALAIARERQVEKPGWAEEFCKKHRK